MYYEYSGWAAELPNRKRTQNSQIASGWPIMPQTQVMQGFLSGSFVLPESTVIS